MSRRRDTRRERVLLKREGSAGRPMNLPAVAASTWAALPPAQEADGLTARLAASHRAKGRLA